MLEALPGVSTVEVDWQKDYAKVSMKPGAKLDEAAAKLEIERDFNVVSITPSSD